MTRPPLHASVVLALLVATAPTAAQEQAAKTAPAQEGAAKQANDALSATKGIPKSAATLRALGKAAAHANKRREVEGISTDAMVRLGKLARAQEKLCESMQAGADKASDNQPRAELVARLSEAMRELLEQTLAPLWSQLPVAALRAGRFDFGSIHARFESALLAQHRAVNACRGKHHAGGDDAAQLASVDLRKDYEAAFEAGVSHALGQHTKLERARADLELALSGYPADRRAAVEARLLAAITKAIEK